MSDKKISQLPAVSTPLAGTEVLPIVQSGVTKKVSVDEINAGLAVYPAAGIPVSTGTAWGSSLPVPLTPANGGTGATTLPANNVLLGNGTSAVLAVAPGTAGNVLTSDGSTWSSTAPTVSGTVTSVGGTGTVNGISLSGTVTSSGNLTLGGALTGVNLGTQVTGTLPVANGGTGQTSYTDGQLLIGNSTGNTLAKATLTAGSGINITNGAGSITIESTAGGGSVTSVAATVPSFLSVTGSPITTSGTLAIAYSGTALPIANGGTSATTANGAINALLPSQTGNSGKVLSTNGTDTSWAAVGGSGTVTSVDVSGGTTGLTTSGGPVTASGTITLAGTLAIANGGTGATSAGAALTSLGAYPDTNPSGFTSNAGTVTSVDATAGTGISVSGGPITSSGSLTITNTAPDQTVVLTAGSGIAVTGAYPSFTIDATGGGGTVTSVGGTGTVNGITLTGTVTSSGSLTLGGTLSGVDLTTQVTGTLPVANGGTGITSLGAGVATFLGTPSSANLASAVTDETGSGSLVFGTTPTLSGPTINDGYTEEVFAVSGTTPALSPADGSIQTWTLSGNSTPTAGTWNAGQSITLMIDDGSAFTVTWTSLAVTWKTDGGVAPTLNTTGFTVITLWKVGTTIYGARVGDA